MASFAAMPIEMPFVPPDWRRKPSGDEMAHVYPQAAADKGLSGRATISCYVRLDGTLRDCKVLSEKPVGFGFGEAAIELSQSFEMYPGIRDGVPQESTVRIPIAFSLPEPEAVVERPEPVFPPIDERAPAVALGVALVAVVLLAALYLLVGRSRA